MIIRREALNAVLPATTADDTRYFLDSIQCEPDAHRIVATNGHVLFIATDTTPIDDADFPAVLGAEFHGNPEPIAVGTDVVRAMLQTMPKRSTLPILGTVQLSQNGSAETVTMAATDLQAPRVATIQRDAAQTFPKYERVLPSPDRPSVRVVLSVEVLEAIIKSAKAISGTGKQTKAYGGTVEFTVPIEHKAGDEWPASNMPCTTAVGLTIKGIDITVTGCAMPCRI